MTASGYHCLVSRKLRLVDSKELEVNNEVDVVVRGVYSSQKLSFL